MAGSKPKYRHLSRSSAHRQALLRNLVDQLFEREHISTTWHKAKEAQRLAERLITMAKENTPESRRQAESYLYVSFSCPTFCRLQVLTGVASETHST